MDAPAWKEIFRSRLVQAALALVCCLLSFFFWGALIVMVPGLLYRCQSGLSLRKRWLICTAWGLVFALVFYSWAALYGGLAWLALVAVRGLPWGLFCLPSFIFERGGEKSVGLQALTCGLGYALVTGVLLLGITGADWETPLAALAAWPWLLSLLPWTGLVGGSLLLGTLSSLVVSGRKRAGLAGLGLFLFVVMISAFRYSQTEPREVDIEVALIQTGWAQDVKWDEENVRSAQERLFSMTEKAATLGAELVIWPETAWPVRSMRRRFKDTRGIGRLARKLEVEILASSIEEVPEGWYNSVSQVLPSGSFEAEYRKRRLAPFAEYIPLPKEHQFTLREMGPFKSISPYLPGERQVLFEIGEVSYGVLICYESMTPSAALSLAEQVDFLVVVTNDAPFFLEWPKEAHFRSAVLRAIATGKPVVQAANNGVTGFINSKGVIIERTPPGFSEATVKHARLVPDHG
jgi:apolipoprotein N-acyltransferase